jgi:hypothetical protein
MVVIHFNGPTIWFRGARAMLIGALIFGVVFFLVGTILGAIAVNNYRDGEATKSWTPTTARVISAEVQEKVDTVRESNGGRRSRYTYTPVVWYEYDVDGRTYQGHQVKADNYSGSQAGAYNTVNRYPVGEEVTAYFDPGDPSRAVLEQGADSTGVYLFGGIGSLFGFIGLGALAFAGSSYRRQRHGAL